MQITKVTPTHFYTYHSPLGEITLAAQDDALAFCIPGRVLFPGLQRATDITNEAANQMQEYLSGKRSVFSVPLTYRGTTFQEAVWHAISLIPYGQTRSYSQIAASIGHPLSQRAVGMAARANPLLFFIPCHRVIAASGALSGYAGSPELKAQLLDLEGATYRR